MTSEVTIDYAVFCIWLTICSVYTSLIAISAIYVLFLLRKHKLFMSKSQRQELELIVATPTLLSEFVTSEAIQRWKKFFDDHNPALASSSDHSEAVPLRESIRLSVTRIFDQQLREIFEDEDLDVIQKEIEQQSRAQKIPCHEPKYSKNTSKNVEVNFKISLETVRIDNSDISMKDTVHTTNVDVVTSDTLEQIDKTLSNERICEVKGNIEANLCVTPKESTRFAVKRSVLSVCEESEEPLVVFHRKRSTLLSETAAFDDYRNTSLFDDDLFNFDSPYDTISQHSKIIQSEASFDVDLNQPLVARHKSVKRKTVVHNSDFSDIWNMDVPSNLVIDSKKQETVESDDAFKDHHVISATKVAPSNVIAKSSDNLKKKIMDAVISFTQAFSHNLIFSRSEQIHSNSNLNLENDTVTQVEPSDTLLSQFYGQDNTLAADEVQNITLNTIDKSELTNDKKTILFLDDKGNVSITQPIPANVTLPDNLSETVKVATSKTLVLADTQRKQSTNKKMNANPEGKADFLQAYKKKSEVLKDRNALMKKFNSITSITVTGDKIRNVRKSKTQLKKGKPISKIRKMNKRRDNVNNIECARCETPAVSSFNITKQKLIVDIASTNVFIDVSLPSIADTEPDKENFNIDDAENFDIKISASQDLLSKLQLPQTNGEIVEREAVAVEPVVTEVSSAQDKEDSTNTLSDDFVERSKDAAKIGNDVSLAEVVALNLLMNEELLLEKLKLRKDEVASMSSSTTTVIHKLNCTDSVESDDTEETEDTINDIKNEKTKGHENSIKSTTDDCFMHEHRKSCVELSPAMMEGLQKEVINAILSFESLKRRLSQPITNASEISEFGDQLSVVSPNPSTTNTDAEVGQEVGNLKSIPSSGSNSIHTVSIPSVPVHELHNTTIEQTKAVASVVQPLAVISEIQLSILDHLLDKNDKTDMIHDKNIEVKISKPFITNEQNTEPETTQDNMFYITKCLLNTAPEGSSDNMFYITSGDTDGQSEASDDESIEIHKETAPQLPIEAEVKSGIQDLEEKIAQLQKHSVKKNLEKVKTINGVHEQNMTLEDLDTEDILEILSRFTAIEEEKDPIKSTVSLKVIAPVKTVENIERKKNVAQRRQSVPLTGSSNVSKRRLSRAPWTPTTNTSHTRRQKSENRTQSQSIQSKSNLSRNKQYQTLKNTLSKKRQQL